MVEKREIIIWISTFATFLAILCSVAIAVMLVNVGAGTTVHPYILGNIIDALVAGGLAVEYYLLITLIATFILLGVTCIFIFRRQPPDPELVRMLVTIGGNVAALRKTQEETLTEMVSQLEYNQKANRRFFSEVNSKVESATQEMIATLGSQEKSIKKVHKDLVALIEGKANETGMKLSADLKEQEKIIAGVKRSTDSSIRALRKQKAELEEIKLGLEKLEEKVIPVQAKLKSLDNVEEIKGIGPHLGEELKGLGITSIHEFLTTDPTLIGEKTRLSPETAQNLQTMAQLLMVPGITDADAEMLIAAGIKSRKELADHDLIQLSGRVRGIAKVYVDQGKISKDESPTIEEICSWIRMAT
jgi:predicted flap endonuclease-1-like 5' DNA nuclease/polyhydroxyalkanoate synthesis regulator phasin